MRHRSFFAAGRSSGLCRGPLNAGLHDPFCLIKPGSCNKEADFTEGGDVWDSCVVRGSQPRSGEQCVPELEAACAGGSSLQGELVHPVYQLPQTLAP
jgi:hypothetical protein